MFFVFLVHELFVNIFAFLTKKQKFVLKSVIKRALPSCKRTYEYLIYASMAEQIFVFSSSFFA